jgi:hypothetical protein
VLNSGAIDGIHRGWRLPTLPSPSPSRFSKILCNSGGLKPAVPFVSVSVELPDDAVEWLQRESLPENWDAKEQPEALKKIGDKWARKKHSLVLAVPSAVTPNEHNFLVNPEHPDFPKIQIFDIQPHEFDTRLFVRSELLKLPS